jgi:uncharacterized protein (DUF1015 family)
MSTVRPFAARIVRQDWAPRAVTAMSDSFDQTGTDALRIAVDPDAYDESAPALYVYRQGDAAGSHAGVVCEMAIQAFVDGQIREHEAVDTWRVEALVRHRVTTTDPPPLVALLHRSGAAFARTLDATARTPPILDFPGPGGLRQTVWRIADGPATTVAQELAGADHYIADGHHRVAAAVEEWRRSGKPAEAGLLCVVYPLDGLHLSAFHRRVIGPVDREALLRLVAAEFDVRVVPEPPAPTSGSFGLYVGRSWFEMRQHRRRGIGVRGLDVSVLQEQVLDRLTELTPGPTHLVEIAPARTSLDELTRRCDADRGALFTLAPASLEAITGLADAGKVMPPKTTYFEPKPCAGIFLRPSRSDSAGVE